MQFVVLGRGMKQYRCYFLNDHGGIADFIAFASINDNDAEKQAREHFGRQSDYLSFEIWEKARLVYREATAGEAAPG